MPLRDRGDRRSLYVSVPGADRISQEGHYATNSPGLASLYPSLFQCRNFPLLPIAEHKLRSRSPAICRSELHGSHPQVHNGPHLYLAAGRLPAGVEGCSYSSQGPWRCLRSTRHPPIRRRCLQVFPTARRSQSSREGLHNRPHRRRPRADCRRRG